MTCRPAGAGWRWPAAWVALLLVVSACRSDRAGDEARAPADADAEAVVTTESRPFTVGPAPDGYELRSAGTGLVEQSWSEGCCGSDEPYTVLSPDGTIGDPEAMVLVAITGYQGSDHGLDQASVAYGSNQEVEVNGEEARFAPSQAADDPQTGTRAHWADLVVAQGDRDLAIRVTAPDATLDDLAAVAERVEVPADHSQPPTVPDPPAGLQVVGSVAADAVTATFARVDATISGGPGPTTAYGVGWLRDEGDDGHLAVMTLPGSSADLDALVAGRRGAAVSGRQVEARREGDIAVFAESRPSSSSDLTRSVWLDDGEGGLVVAIATASTPPDEATLVALARSVEPTDQVTWEDFVTQARGGPGFHADPGRVELMRGTAPDGREWLLQDDAARLPRVPAPPPAPPSSPGPRTTHSRASTPA